MERVTGCPDRLGDLALLASEALTGAAADELRQHIVECGGCRAEVASLLPVAALLRDAPVPVTSDGGPAPLAGAPASHDLAERIAERVRADVRHRRRRRVVVIAVCAAAAMVLLVGVGALAGALVGSRSDDPTLSSFTTAAEGASGRFALSSTAGATQVRLVASGLDPDEVYWLWLTDASGTRTSAGTFRGGDIDLTLAAALPLERTERVWVTDAADAVVLDARIDS
jgi:hypothetical protein